MGHYGRVDILINNAGAGLYAPSWSAPEQDVRRLFELNFFAAWDMIRLVVPAMRHERSGMIVNIGSIAGRVTLPWFTMYSATKYALGSLTEGLRMELARDGVRTMSVCPGYVRTLFQQHVLGGRPPESVVRSKRFAVTAERCAEAVADGVERDARTVVTPRVGWMLIAFARLFPATLEGRLAGILHSNASAGKAS
jgi:short-subunit dehydrogenase